MKKHGIGSRLISLLLAMVLVVSVLPVSAFAAVGDMAVGEYIGDTGLASDIDTKTTISWPIKIYDYLNDGMLFEYTNASDTSIEDELGGAYGGGMPAPQYAGAQNVIGTDYTVNWGYSKFSYTTWLKSRSAFEATGSLVEAANFKYPSHLHLVPDNTYTDMKPWVMSDFYNDNSVSYYARDTVRYAVVVYRTSGLEEGEARLNLGWETNLVGSHQYPGYTDVNYDYRGSVELVANSEQWNYVVIDMNAGTLGEKWDTITSVYKVIADFQMTDPNDSVDISHVAYFDTEFEAIEFGKDAVAFDNDPGEYLYSHTEYLDGVEVAVEKPTTSNNGMDFSVSDNTAGGYKVDTYQDWTTAETGYYIGTMNGVSVTEVENGERSYVQVSNANKSTNGNIKVWDYSGGGSFTHVTIVYKTTNFTADDLISFYVKYSGYYGGGANMYSNGIAGVGSATKITLAKSEGEWTYVTYAFSQIYNANSSLGDPDYVAGSNYNTYGLYLPACMTGHNMTLDIAMIDMFGSANAATSYGQQAADYMNGKTEMVYGQTKTTTTKKWNTGNTVAFSMLYANQGGGWFDDNYAGGPNANSNGYYSYQIGATATRDSNYVTDTVSTVNNQRLAAKNTYGYPVSDTIFLVNDGYLMNTTDADTTNDDYDVSNLNLGYTLYNTLNSGLYTAGLLKSGLTTVTANGKTYRVPDYKEDTVEYIALLLQQSLIIPETDASGNYNYNFIKGTANGEQYGYDDNNEAMDLASALRKQLGITFTGANKGTIPSTTVIGDYSTMTDAHKAELIGSFADCKAKIETFVDAAYYLLMNLYVDDSYNQAQDEYNYLVLSQATVDVGYDDVTSNDKTAYVFDGGFTTGIAANTENTDEYRTSSQSAVKYDKATGTISLTASNSKDQVYFGSKNTKAYLTTRFPFLPVTDSEGVYAGETKSQYFLDDGRGPMGVTEEGATFVNRNYNFAVACNGEFVYHEEDDLFFQFEGDDDVYLFINGELVLDIGGAHSITDVSMSVNDYVNWAKQVLANPSGYSATDVARAEKLNLVEGGTYSFDFYYMERHGWGSNCRIATNIRVTDPAMQVEKTASQYGEDVAYGSEVDKNGPIAYNFYLENTGNTKLYNLTFSDHNIGVTLDYNTGLTINNEATTNGITVMDAQGGELDVTDLEAYVTGYEYVGTGGTHGYDTATGEYVAAEDGEYRYNESTVTFADQDALKAFLSTLAGKGLIADDSNTTSDSNESNPRQGSGLWVDGTVTIRGIYYKLTQLQIDDGVFNNTVYVTATNKAETETLYSQASHRVYVSSSTSYYQWAGNELFLSVKKLLDDATTASHNVGNELHEDVSFFDHVKYDTSKISTTIDYTTNAEDTNPNAEVKTGGYSIKYVSPGIYTFHVNMSLISTENIDTTKVKTAASIPVTVYVTDVEDSVFVLDYGLTTESLDANGELFKNDALLGASGENTAKLMGISNTQPSYLDIASSPDDYNRISFTSWDLNENKVIEPYNVVVDEDGNVVVDEDGNPVSDPNGEFTMSLSIPESGKTITYNAITNKYSLTETGTVTVYVDMQGSDWDKVYLYYWYESNTSNAQVPAWPGTEMTLDSTTGKYSLNIPDDVSNIIICNNNGAQTENLSMTPGVETTFTVAAGTEGGYTVSKSTVVRNVTFHATVPSDWGDNVYLSYTEENGTTETKLMTKDSDGSFSVVVPGDVTKAQLSNAETNPTKKTVELAVYASRETWINVNKTAYNSTVSYTYPETVTITATDVPNTWTDVCLYYWDGNGTDNVWPGEAMNKNEDGSYSFTIPSGNIPNVIINGKIGENENGEEQREQTVDLSITAGKNAVIAVNTDEETKNEGKYTAQITSTGSTTVTVTTVPADWTVVKLDCYNSSGEEVGDSISITVTDGSYSATIDSADIAYVVINGGDGKETDKLAVQGTAMTVAVDALYSALATYSNDTRTIHAKVPSDWTNVNLYCWDDTGAYYKAWPGEAMTRGDDGWYTLDIPSDITNVIINNTITENGSNTYIQTVDLTVQAGVESWIEVSDQTETQSDGRAMHTASVSEAGFTYTPTDFMDGLDSVWLAMTVHKMGTSATKLNSEININNEVQMYKKVTVLPASVVYYEDDFPAIRYESVKTDGTISSTTNVITQIGTGSSDLTQSVDQEQEYGQDETYQNNSEYSGNSQHVIEIKDANNFAWFQFKGTGFELIASTEADSYATIVVTVLDKNDNAVQRIPVINQFDNGDDGGTEKIYQVPVIRVEGLDYNSGPYKVYINGAPAKNYDAGKNENGEYEVIPSYLYLDGLRIYEPLGDTNVAQYNDNERGATFAELRDLICEGQVAVAELTGEALNISTGTSTWTENLNGTNSEGKTYEGNKVDSVNDYLTMGPNNEVYMQGELGTEALAFYVTETGTGTHNLQIAVHAIDAGLFYGSASTGMNAEIQYGIKKSDGSYAWTHLVTVTSGTEQYYTIPYTNCPEVSEGKYQVVLRVVGETETVTENGKEVTKVKTPSMISYTSLKYNGLEISEIEGTGEAATMRYGQYGLEILNSDDKWYSQEMTEEGTGDVIRYNATDKVWEKKVTDNEGNVTWTTMTQNEVDSISTLSVEDDYPEFESLSLQMRATTVAAPGDVADSDVTEPTEPETEPTEPETEPTEPETEPTEPETEPTEPETEPTEPETEPTEPETEPTEPETQPTEPEASEPSNSGNGNSGSSKPGKDESYKNNLWKSLMDTINYLFALIGKR